MLVSDTSNKTVKYCSKSGANNSKAKMDQGVNLRVKGMLFL